MSNLPTCPNCEKSPEWAGKYCQDCWEKHTAARFHEELEKLGAGDRPFIATTGQRVQVKPAGDDLVSITFDGQDKSVVVVLSSDSAIDFAQTLITCAITVTVMGRIEAMAKAENHEQN